MKKISRNKNYKNVIVTEKIYFKNNGCGYGPFIKSEIVDIKAEEAKAK